MNDDVTPVAPPASGGARRVAFVAHCLVNQNAKVQEFARSPGVVPGVVERMRRHGYRIQQLPCPEMAFAGVVGLDGSPSSGVRYTGMARSWGGRPHFEDDDHEVVEGMGVWMEELRKGREERGIPWPRASGMLLDTTDWDEARDLPRCLDELDEFLAGGGLTAEVPDAQS